MTNEEQAACLEFARTFGWPEWDEDDHKYRFIHRAQLCWRLEAKDHEGFWHDCLGYSDAMARDRWIIWLMEEAARLNEGSMLKIELSKAPPCFVQMGQAHGVGGSPLLALLDAASQVKRQEVIKYLGQAGYTARYTKTHITSQDDEPGYVTLGAKYER